MARQREYRAEYQRRLSRGLERGLSRGEARGHGRAPEHPERAFSDPYRWQSYLVRLAGRRPLRPTEERALARLNDRRRREGKAPIVFAFRPMPGPGTRQGEAATLEEADEASDGPPPDYKTIYLTPEGWLWEKRAGIGRGRRRRAA